MINLSGVKAFLIGGFFLFISCYMVLFHPPNTEFHHHIYDLEITQLQTGSQTLKILNRDGLIHNKLTFWIASWVLGLHHHQLAPGLYQIEKNWSNKQMIQYLKHTPRESVSVVIRPYRMRKNTINGICKALDIKPSALTRHLQNPQYIGKWGKFNPDNVYSILFADTILMYRDSRAQEVADRLFRNFWYYWTPEKLTKAASLGLTAQEASILASIVYAETKIPDEMPIIAGLYLNRLSQEMRLQADPTVVYAVGKPLSRVLTGHKKVRSKYNTYRVDGLPPGPVFTPSEQSLQAVLEAESHDYLYFCARFDFSGYHHFSRTLKEHQNVARKYQRELNKRRIGFKGS